MARYDNSWKTNPKTMFASLPVEYMAQKLSKIKQEKDYTTSLLDGALPVRYDTKLVNPDLIKKKQQQFKNDLNQLRGNMIGATDFTSIVGDINKIRDSQGLTPNRGISYNQNTNSGTGSSGTSGSSKSSNKKYNVGSNFEYNTWGEISESNLKEAEDTEKYYESQKSPDVAAYLWKYLDKPRYNEYNRTGGDPDQQSRMNYVKTEIYDPEVMRKAVTAMTKGFEDDGEAAVQAYGDYIGVAKRLFVTRDDVHGNEYSGTFGYIWQNAQWNDYQDTIYEYGTEKTGKIDATTYANYWLQTRAENDIQREYKTKYGNNWESTYYADLNAGKLNTKFKKIQDDKFNTDKALIKKEHPDWTDDQIAQELIVNNYGKKGYKYNQAELLTDQQVRREAHDNRSIGSLRQSAISKLRNGKALIDYENSNFNVSTNAPIDLPTDPGKRETTITTLFNEQPLVEGQVTNATTKFKDAEKGFYGLFSARDKTPVDPLNPIAKVNRDLQEQSDKRILLDSGVGYVEDNNGNITFNPNDIGKLRIITGNPNLTASDAWIVAANYNQAKTNLNDKLEDQFNSDYFLNSMTNKWASSDDGQRDINSLWVKLGGVEGKTITTTVNGKEKTFSKSDLPIMIKRGDNIEYKGSDKGEYSYMTEGTRILDLSDYQNNIAKWGSRSENMAGQNKIVFLYTGDPDKVKSLKGVKNNMGLLSTPQTAPTVTSIEGITLADMAADKGFNMANHDMTYKMISAKAGTGSGDNGLIYGVTYTVTGLDKNGKSLTRNISFLTDETGLNNAQNGIKFSKGFVDSWVYEANGIRNSSALLSKDQYNGKLAVLYQGIGTEKVNRKTVFHNGVDLIAENLNNSTIKNTGIIRSQDGFDFYYHKENHTWIPYALDTNTGKSYDLTLNSELGLQPVTTGSGVIQQQGLLYSRAVDTHVIDKKDLFKTQNYK